MRLLHVITGLRKAAGTSVFCGELANELIVQGHQVTVAVADPTSEDHYSLNSNVRFVSIEDILKLSGGFEIVHIHALWSPILHRVTHWAHQKGVPVVWSPHGMLAPWSMAHKRWKKILPWYLYQRGDLNRAVLLHATSEMEAGWIRDLGFAQEIIIAPLGSHLPSPVSLRHHELKTILFVGRIYPVKGLDRLITAWSLLSPDIRHGWQVRLVGPDQAGHMEELKRLADRASVSQEVHFTGPLFGKHLVDAYQDADVFVLPSFTENFGGVVVDAMSYGLPVITTKGTPWAELLGNEENVNGKPLTVNSGQLPKDCREYENVNGKPLKVRGKPFSDAQYGGNQSYTANDSRLTEYTANGRCGWWIDIGVEPLAEALLEAMSLSNEDRRTMGENGRKLVDAKYTWPAIAEQMKSAYDWILKGGEKPDCVCV